MAAEVKERVDEALPDDVWESKEVQEFGLQGDVITEGPQAIER
jgi:hypothetical protein